MVNISLYRLIPPALPILECLFAAHSVQPACYVLRFFCWSSRQEKKIASERDAECRRADRIGEVVVAGWLQLLRRDGSNGSSRHFTAWRNFGRCRSEADIGPNFMSTQPDPSL